MNRFHIYYTNKMKQQNIPVNAMRLYFIFRSTPGARVKGCRERGGERIRGRSLRCERAAPPAQTYRASCRGRWSPGRRGREGSRRRLGSTETAKATFARLPTSAREVVGLRVPTCPRAYRGLLELWGGWGEGVIKGWS